MLALVEVYSRRVLIIWISVCFEYPKMFHLFCSPFPWIQYFCMSQPIGASVAVSIKVTTMMMFLAVHCIVEILSSRYEATVSSVSSFGCKGLTE